MLWITTGVLLLSAHGHQAALIGVAQPIHRLHGLLHVLV
jgi:hypothetical protein